MCIMREINQTLQHWYSDIETVFLALIEIIQKFTREIL